MSFIKIHAPMELLKRYAEILKIRMPIRVSFFLIITTGFSFVIFLFFLFNTWIICLGRYTENQGKLISTF